VQKSNNQSFHHSRWS